MRLIDDLLLDDFFHGGYQPGTSLPLPQAQAAVAPPAVPSTPQPTVQPTPPRSVVAEKQPATRRTPIAAIAVGLVVVGLAVGAWWSWMRTPGPRMGSSEVSMAALGPTSTTVQVQTPRVAQSAAEPTTIESNVQPSTPTPSRLLQESDATSQPVAQARAPVSETASVAFSLIFNATPNQEEAQRWAALAEAQGLRARVKTLKKTVKLYRVASTKGYDQSAAKAIGLKATVFKIPVTTQVAGDGTTHFDLGRFKAPAVAEKALANAQKLGLEAAVVEEAQSAPAYTVEAGTLLSELEAQTLAASLSQTSGTKVTIQKVR